MTGSQQNQQPEDRSGYGLYVHVPFCRSKCPYCGFFSIPGRKLVPRYLKALRLEMELYADQALVYDSLYLGGGTPSCLSATELGQIVRDLERNFFFSPDCERTIEVNPGDVNRELAETLYLLGFNRVSVGVQSFEEHELNFLGRRHCPRQAQRAVETLSAAGFTNIGLDLIYGLPGQSPRSWQRSLRRALELKPAHLSCYELTVEPKTILAAACARGQRKLPSEEILKTLFLTASDILSQAGYLHYEVSNYAGREEWKARHNCKYWQRCPTLGLGAAAHSFDGTRRRWNVRSVREYCRRLEKGCPATLGEETLSAEEVQLELLALGLRTAEGCSQECLPANEQTTKILERLTRMGLLRLAQDRVLPTRKGLLVADALPAMFF